MEHLSLQKKRNKFDVKNKFNSNNMMPTTKKSKTWWNVMWLCLIWMSRITFQMRWNMFHIYTSSFRHPSQCLKSERPSCVWCFKNPSLSFWNGPCFRKLNIPFPFGIMKVNELTKGDVNLEMLTKIWKWLFKLQANTI